ncbi:6765_t:CDS:2 [Diversispora eburnea]|uniref:6765_t:CDS:1 n=1 Tax=Diversispora eburnea TaxID=1213867 RepID=A0A9N9C1R9_9GLOM|nr:6765_t:CDS:2 [Diversispora eburnea]
MLTLAEVCPFLKPRNNVLHGFCFKIYHIPCRYYGTKIKYSTSKSKIPYKKPKILINNANNKTYDVTHKLLPLPIPLGKTILQEKKEKTKRSKVSNRQLFKQIQAPDETFREITTLNLAKPKRYRIGKYDTKVAIIAKKKLEAKLGNAEREKEEYLELPHLSFFAGAKVPSSFPPERVSEIAFVVVRTSDKPGLTQQINFYAAGTIFNLIDMPGYGFAYVNEEERLQWKNLVSLL